MTQLLLAALALPLSLPAAALDWSADPVASAPRFAAPRPAPALAALPAGAKRPKLKLDRKNLDAMLDGLLKAFPDEQRARPLGPIVDDIGLVHYLGVSFLLRDKASQDTVAVVFYDLSAYEAGVWNVPGAPRAPRKEAVGFTVEGLRYLYAKTYAPDRAAELEPEQKDGLQPEELAEIATMPFPMMEAIEQVFDQLRSSK